MCLAQFPPAGLRDLCRRFLPILSPQVVFSRKPPKGCLAQQACLFAYLATFRLVGVFFALALPFPSLLRTCPKTAPEVAQATKAVAEAHYLTRHDSPPK